MVVSKRCKICTVIEADNMPISGEYFGKLMPEMIAKITGVELDSRKLVDVLICQQCAIQLVHTESVVNKIRERCSKLCKPKPAIRTPSKIVASNKAKDATPTRKKKETPKAVPSPKPNGEAILKRISDDLDDTALKRDETTEDDIFEKCMDGTELNRDEATGNVTFKKFTDDLDDTILKSVEATPAKKISAKRKLEDSHLNGIADVSSELQNIRQPDDTNELDKGLLVEKGKKRKKSSLSVTETVSEFEISSAIGAESVGDNKKKDINCVLCGKMFNQKSTLREHIETSHMGEKLKECPNCCMEFRSLQKYESHVFGEKCKGILHPCQFDNCNRRFKNVYKMEAHMREKHLSICAVDAE